jgi:hypothetical protein
MDRTSQGVDASAGTRSRNEIRVSSVPDVLPDTTADSRTPDLDELSLATLIDFFKLLDRWDREGKSVC